MPQPRISFIVVSYQKRFLLERCVASLRAQDLDGLEIIVVDNGSQDGTWEWLQAQGAALRCLRLDSNTGFTGGNLAGYGLAQGEAVALVNNDVTLDPAWARRAWEALESGPRIGAVACKILSMVHPDRIESAGLLLLKSGRLVSRGEGRAATDCAEPCQVFGAPGAAVLYRQAALAEAGFLDPVYFFNCEDWDLAFRLQRSGWTCTYAPAALAWHLGGASHPLLGGKALYYWARNVELAWLSNSPWRFLLRGLPHKLLHEAGTLLRFLRRGYGLGNYLAGKAAVLGCLGQIWRARRNWTTQGPANWSLALEEARSLFQTRHLAAQGRSLWQRRPALPLSEL